MKQINIIILAVMLSGCSLFPKAIEPIEVVTIQERPPMYHPPLPMEMQLGEVVFEVLTPDIMAEYSKLVEEGNAPAKPYYALTTQQYENLSMNMAEIKRYVTNILQVVKFYRDYDKEENKEEPSQK
jgi:hypothetical protein